MKRIMYRNSCLFDTLSQIPVKIANAGKSKSLKPTKLISQMLGGKIGKTLKTLQDK